MTTRTFSIPDNEWEQLRKQAYLLNLSVSEVIRRAVSLYLEHYTLEEVTDEDREKSNQ